MEHIKNCESCGMPMRNAEDFGGQYLHNQYCRYCTDEQGELKRYEDVLNNLTNFIVQTQGLEKGQAELAAKEGLAQMPAWKDR